MSGFAFAGYPAPFIHREPKGGKVQQLLWGDHVRLLGERTGEWVKVKSRRETGWMNEKDLQKERLLEVCFVDIGQGDGSFLVLPDDSFMLVDAGESDNMLRFLSWRFNLRNNPNRKIPIRQAVISHPDQDHYKGFSPLFASNQFEFDVVYHNGIVERSGDDVLGPVETSGGRRYLMDVITDPDALRERLADPAFVGAKQYPKMLAKALKAGVVKQFCGIDAESGHLPGFGPEKELSIQVLGPCAEKIGDTKSLRWLGDPGKTKNGHSVVLKLTYRKVRLMLGGDLNVPAEHHLLSAHTGLDVPARDDLAAQDALVSAARRIFEADVAKACHHGSADFTSLYLRAVNPVATVISSGDDEPHAHPRPDAIGAFGKFGRGERPLVFSTELARSSNENIREPRALRRDVEELYQRREELEDPDRRATVDAAIDKLLGKLERSVAVYGLINVRTDGRRIVLSQKLERKRAQTSEEWDVHRVEADATGEFRYVSKHQ